MTRSKNCPWKSRLVAFAVEIEPENTGKTGRHALMGLLLRWLRRLRWYWNVVSIVLKV